MAMQPCPIIMVGYSPADGGSKVKMDYIRSLFPTLWEIIPDLGYIKIPNSTKFNVTVNEFRVFTCQSV